MSKEKREKHQDKMAAPGLDPKREGESEADYLYRMSDRISNITQDNDSEKHQERNLAKKCMKEIANEECRESSDIPVQHGSIVEP